MAELNRWKGPTKREPTSYSYLAEFSVTQHAERWFYKLYLKTFSQRARYHSARSSSPRGPACWYLSYACLPVRKLLILSSKNKSTMSSPKCMKTAALRIFEGLIWISKKIHCSKSTNHGNQMHQCILGWCKSWLISERRFHFTKKLFLYFQCVGADF